MKRALGLLILLSCGLAAGQRPAPLPPLRQQAEIQQHWLRLRLERVLPSLMRKHGVEMWLVISREYNEDPVFFSLVSPTTLAARRRTIFVFYDRGQEKGVERLSVGGGSQGGLYTIYRDPDDPAREAWGDAQWQLLRRVIEDRKPATIAIDISHTHAFADGLSAGEREQLDDALGAQWTKRIVPSGNLALEYLEIRVSEMLPLYQQMMETAHWLIGRAFSSEVITPGQTTNQDVVWWLRQQVASLGLGTWFHPSVRVQKPGGPLVSPAGGETAPVVIERGDVVHVDFGITAMRLNTDTQHMAYVLRPGETAPPPGVLHALKNANRLQDIVLERLRPGRSGNEVLADSLAAMKTEGIRGAVYSHPVGDHGHAAGPLIGLWDRQEGVAGRGDTMLLPNTWISIELSATTPIPEWGGRDLWIGEEEDVAIDETGRAAWIAPRQTEFHLVK